MFGMEDIDMGNTQSIAFSPGSISPQSLDKLKFPELTINPLASKLFATGSKEYDLICAYKRIFAQIPDLSEIVSEISRIAIAFAMRKEQDTKSLEADVICACQKFLAHKNKKDVFSDRVISSLLCSH
jgi:hypothetical protein